MFKQILQKLTTPLTLLALSVSFAASASEIDTIDVNVVLEKDGTAHISEHWSVDVDDSNTEWYISLKNMGSMKVTNFKVYDNDNKTYFWEDTPWDVDRNRREKEGKCGINRLADNDCELCWGVGYSGPRSWTAQYDIEGFVKQFEDGNGFNHTFVNYGLSAEPKFVRTTISLADNTPLSFQNARIWAFQYRGLCNFIDGKVVAVSSEPLSTENSMIVMCLFPKDMFCSQNVVNDTIGAMKWTALEGSDYLSEYTENDYAEGRNVLIKEEEDLSWWEEILIVLAIIAIGGLLYGLGYLLMAFGFIFGIVVLWNIVSLRPLRIYLRRKRLMKDSKSPYFKGIPINGDLNRAFYVLDENNYKVLPEDKDNLYAAYLVRLMRLKAIDIVSTVENGKIVNRLHITKKGLDLNDTTLANSARATGTEVQPTDNRNLPSAAATGTLPQDNAAENANNKESDAINPGKDTNGKSKKKEDKNLCLKRLYNAIKQAAGENKILEKGELKSHLEAHQSVAKIIVDATSCSTERTTPEEYQELIGLKKFLEDFTIIETTDAVEVELWDEYLVYATLFGIADKVLKNFKESCPDYFKKSWIGAQLIDNNGEVISDFNSYTGISKIGSGIRSWTSSSSSSSSSGGGGYSSSGGGGGSSGGGGGGGGR